METIRQDLGYALRTLRRSPGFTAVVVLTLGLGIGANTAIFSVMDQVLLRVLPVKNPEELVLLDGPGPFQGRTFNDNTFSYPTYRDLRDQSPVFSGTLARFPANLNLSYKGQTERVDGELVSGNFFDVLGVQPVLGRAFTPDDDRTPGAHPVMMLSHGFWSRRFAAAPGIVGQTLSLNGHAMTVIGIAPPGFHGIEVGASPDVLVPIMMKAQMTPTWDDLENHQSRWLNVMARLKPGTTREQAEVAMNVVYKQILQEDIKLVRQPSERFRTRFLAKHLSLLPGFKGRSELRNRFSTPLVVLMAMVGLVLMIACANVANLLVARAASRQKEVAIRLALGAGRGRIVAQLLVESLLLSLAGGLCGLLIASWTTDLLLRALPFESAARTFSAGLDWRVAAFAMAVSLGTGLIFGLVPAFQATRPVLTTTLKEEAGSVVGGAPQVRFRKVLVVAQVALSLLLLIGAGLFARSLYNLRNLNPGFRADHLMSFTIDPSLNGYSQERLQSLFPELQDRLAALPGVRSASTALLPLMTDSNWGMTVQVDGYQAKEGEDLNPGVNAVGPGFFTTMEIPLVAGREFTAQDVAGAPAVAVVNETFARYFWGKESPIGHRFGFGRGKATDIEIVGVVKDGKSASLREEIPRFLYIPTVQAPELGGAVYYVRTVQDPAALGQTLRQAVLQVDPNLPVSDLKTMTRQVDESLFIDRTISGLSAAFGLLATFLAALGLYGVMSYSVARRTREIGIRMALGAAQGTVLRLVLSEVAWMATIGILIGLPSAWAASRFLESQLFGLKAADPAVSALATVTLAIVTLVAGYLPARRATEIDPMVALRYE